MKQYSASRDPVGAWMALPREIRRAIARFTPRELDRPVIEGAISIRMNVHHLVEANLIASNLVIAALGAPGTRYDWSWLWPGASWMKRLGYEKLPLEPSLALLEALGKHLGAIVRRAPKARRAVVRLFDGPGTKLRTRTVAELLADECAHAQEHLAEIAAAKAILRG